MFCPKCGTKNPEDGKFCRSCGVDLGNVSAAMSGTLVPKLSDLGFGSCSSESKSDVRRRSNPAEVYGDAVRSVIFGIGFFIISIALFITGVAGGKAWWWAMLFPAFTFLARGISDLLKSRRMEKTRTAFAPATGNMISQPGVQASLPSTNADYISPESRYKTGDLVPPSVTDSTTRHLEVNAEGETMTLPKN